MHGDQDFLWKYDQVLQGKSNTLQPPPFNCFIRDMLVIIIYKGQRMKTIFRTMKLNIKQKVTSKSLAK